MIYKDYEIVLERQECEIWSLDESGEAEDYLNECEDSMHQGGTYTYLVRDNKGVERARKYAFYEAKTAIDQMVVAERVSSAAPQHHYCRSAYVPVITEAA